jgi:Dual specificity phosphatase, catalytic domain
MLKRNNVSHILCTAGELRAVFPQDFTYKMISASDHPGFNLGAHLDSAADFIHRSIQHGTGILVHCYMGISRSTTCVIAYLMKYENLTITAAYALCKKIRPIICPNPGFMLQLRKYYDRLKSVPKARDILNQSGLDRTGNISINLNENQNIHNQ